MAGTASHCASRVSLWAARSAQEMHGEERGLIRPDRFRPIASTAGKILELGDRIFVRILGMDRLAVFEGKAFAADIDRLCAAADEMHLHPARFIVPTGAVEELIEVKRAADLAIDPPQKIEIEGRRHAGRIIIGAHQHALVLAQVDPDDHR